MPNAIQRRRGTTVGHSTFTGLLGEITVDTDKKTVVVHDGVTAGGNALATEPTVATRLASKVSLDSATGAARWPAGTTAQRPVAGVQVGDSRFNTTLNSPEVWNGTSWAPMGGGATGAPGNNVFVENDQAVTADYTLTAGKNAMSAGPISINTGVTVTVPTGATWSIV